MADGSVQGAYRGARGRWQVTLEGADQAVANLLSLGRSGAEGLKQAINTTVRRGKTLATRKITSHLNLRSRYVSDRIYIKLANNSALVGTISAKDRDRAVLLSRYGAKQEWTRTTVIGARGKAKSVRRRGGISVQVLADGERKTLPGAFFITLKGNGIQAVAMREKNAAGNYTGRRYAGKNGKRGNVAVDVLYGPGIYRQFGWFLPELSATLSSTLLAEATRQYERRLPKGRRVVVTP